MPTRVCRRQADILLIGTADGYANVHGPNERVLLVSGLTGLLLFLLIAQFIA